MIRRLLRILALLVVLAVVGAIILVLNLNKVVKSGVEKGGRLVLKVPTSLEGASVRLAGGTVGLDGLTVGSPSGFSADQMLRLAHTHATVDLWSLRSDEIIVKEVVVDGLEITYERADGKSNWSVLMERLQGEPTEDEKKELPARIRLDRLEFKNGTIRVVGLPVLEEVSIPLPTIELTDLRTADGKGKTARQVLSQVSAALYRSVVGAMEGSLPAEELRKVRGEAQRMLKDAGGLIEDAGSDVKGVIEEGEEKVREAWDDLIGKPAESEGE